MLQGQDMDGGILCHLLPSTPWSPWSPFQVAEVTSGSCGGRGALLACAAGGSPGEQGRPGGYTAPRCPLRLWRQGPESVLVPVQLLAWTRDSPGSGGCNQPRASRGKQADMCTPALMRVHALFLLVSCPSWARLPVDRFLSARTCLCVLPYPCTHSSSPGQPHLNTHVGTYM